MERLTRRINGVVVYVGVKNPYSTGQIPCEVEPAGVREMMDRLAACEDTGLEPEEITVMRHTLDEYHKVADPLLRAQADGRLVVLPCKIGDTVWAILDGKKHVCKCIVEFINIGGLCTTVVLCKIDGLREQYSATAASLSKTVFLTREEAEKALEAMKDD